MKRCSSHLVDQRNRALSHGTDLLGWFCDAPSSHSTLRRQQDKPYSSSPALSSATPLSWISNQVSALHLGCVCGYRVPLPCLGVWGEAVAGLPLVQNVSTRREAAQQHGFSLFMSLARQLCDVLSN